MFGKNDYSSYGRSESKLGPKLIFMLILAIVLGLGYFQVIKMYESRANVALAIGDFERARTALVRVGSLPFNGGRSEHGLGAIALVQGDVSQAEAHFAAVLARKPGSMGIKPGLISSVLIFNGRYQDADRYRQFLEKWKSASELEEENLDFAAISLALRASDQAKNYLQAVPELQRQDPRFVSLEKKLQEMQKTGEAPLLLDRHGKPYLVWQLGKGGYSFVPDQLFAGWVNENGPILDNLSEADRYHVINTSLDLNLQKAVFQAMKGYEGTIIIAEPGSGEILAAYGTEGHPPFTTGFEPGSVIKVMTYGTFLETGSNTTPYAPRKYPGNMEIGGKIFYDWTTQGQLDSVNQGMAVSCNLMFAQMGNELGWSRWNAGVQKYFNDQPPMGLIAPAQLGRLVSEPDGAFELGRASIGLDFLQTTVLGLVQIPMSIGNQGKLAELRLVRSHLNIDGEVCKAIPQARPVDIYSVETAQELLGSLVESVTFERGTARRAQVDFVETGMKTGTAGERPFDSILIGLVPVGQPKLAFALFLDKGGKCEINGALVAKRLLEQIRALAPEYLEMKQ